MTAFAVSACPTHAMSRHAVRNAMLFVALVGCVLRIGVAFWNAFWGPSFGAEMDAAEFHAFAVLAAAGQKDDRDFGIGWIYGNALGLLYRILGDALIVGSLASVAAWAVATRYSLAAARIAGLGVQAQYKLVVVSSLLPSSVLFTGVTLREPFQMAFVAFGLYHSIRFVVERRFADAMLAVAGLALAGLLHGALMAFCGVATALMLVFASRSRRWAAVTVVASVGLAVVALEVVVGLSGYNFDEGILGGINLFHAGAPGDARANYVDGLELTSPLQLLFVVPQMVLQYLFEPLPWRIATFGDVYLFAENALRLVLVTAAVRASLKPGAGGQVQRFVLLFYVCLETIWALGTINWGTAARHHLPAWSALLVAGLFEQGRRTRSRRTKKQAGRGLSDVVSFS